MSRLKFHWPSPALAVSIVALVIAMGGSAVAATKLLVHTRNLANGAVTNKKIHSGAVSAQKLDNALRAELAKAGQARGIVTGAPGPKGNTGATGPQGPKGDTGAQGNPGHDGRDGLNPAVAVVNVPSIADSSGKNPNPDSGDAGDQGFYFTGDGAGGAASLTNGELELTGNGIDGNTVQGGIGIAKAYNNLPLGALDAISYQWHVNQVNATQAPTVHVTVTGMSAANSKYGPGCANPPCSGFANLDYTPAINGITPSAGVVYQSDGFAPNAKWYSTTNPDISAAGGQDNPETLAQFVTANPNAVIVQISLDNGGTSGGTGSFDAGADDLVIGTSGNGSFTRYDFGG